MPENFESGREKGNAILALKRKTEISHSDKTNQLRQCCPIYSWFKWICLAIWWYARDEHIIWNNENIRFKFIKRDKHVVFRLMHFYWVIGFNISRDLSRLFRQMWIWRVCYFDSFSFRKSGAIIFEGLKDMERDVWRWLTQLMDVEIVAKWFFSDTTDFVANLEIVL